MPPFAAQLLVTTHCIARLDHVLQSRHKLPHKSFTSYNRTYILVLQVVCPLLDLSSLLVQINIYFILNFSQCEFNKGQWIIQSAWVSFVLLTWYCKAECRDPPLFRQLLRNKDDFLPRQFCGSWDGWRGQCRICRLFHRWASWLLMVHVGGLFVMRSTPSVTSTQDFHLLLKLVHLSYQWIWWLLQRQRWLYFFHHLEKCGVCNLRFRIRQEARRHCCPVDHEYYTKSEVLIFNQPKVGLMQYRWL